MARVRQEQPQRMSVVNVMMTAPVRYEGFIEKVSGGYTVEFRKPRCSRGLVRTFAASQVIATRRPDGGEIGEIWVIEATSLLGEIEGVVSGSTIIDEKGNHIEIGAAGAAHTQYVAEIDIEELRGDTRKRVVRSAGEVDENAPKKGPFGRPIRQEEAPSKPARGRAKPVVEEEDEEEDATPVKATRGRAKPAPEPEPVRRRRRASEDDFE